MTYSKNIFSVKNFLLAAVAVFFLSNCGDQELAAVSDDAVMTAASVSGPTAQSITITGSNTRFSTAVACNTCTYVVDVKAKVVDGKELGLKPGSVICLDAALKYGNVDFVNLEGTSDSPITIGNCNSAIASR